MTRTPTPAEIEMLRENIRKAENVAESLAILDRLSPPAPEVDEATLVWREMTAQAYEAVNNSGMAEAWRTGEMDASKWQAGQLHHLREVLAAKDAERDHREKAWLGWQERCLKAESELAALRAEIERLKADNMPPEGYTNLYIAARDCIFDANKLGRIEDGWLLLENVNVLVTSKAAERNTAEPEPFKRPTDPTDKQWDEWTSHLGTNAGAVEVLWNSICSEPDVDAIPLLSKALTEAEARGRREALEAIDAKLVWYEQYGNGLLRMREAARLLRATINSMMTGEK